MEQNFKIETIEAQIRECYGKVVWTHKIHEKCADLLNQRHDRIKLWQIMLSVVTTSGILVSVFGDSRESGVVSAIFSLVLAILNTYIKNIILAGLHKNIQMLLFLYGIYEKVICRYLQIFMQENWIMMK